MNWKDLAERVGKFAPMVGTVLGGPAGGVVGAMVASALGVDNNPSAVSDALAVNPDAAVKIAQIESDERVQLQRLVVEQANHEMTALVQHSSDINSTMRVEAAAEHWPTYSWRPAIGFAVAINVTLSVIVVAFAYVGVMFFKVESEVLSYLPAMLGSMAALVAVASPILGIASWFRGKAQADPNIKTNNLG